MDDDLLVRVKHAARAAGLSVNGYLTRVMQVATSEDEQTSEAERLRHRLRAAGLAPTPVAKRRLAAPDPALVAQAARRAAEGTLLSDIVVADRE